VPIRACLLTDIQKLVANLVDCLRPRNPLPLAVHQLGRIAQAAVAQHVVSNGRPFAAMGSAIDWAVIIRLLADPHAVCDFGNHRTPNRAMGADILAGRDGLTGWWRGTGLCLPQAAERQIAQHCQRSGGDTGALQEGTAVHVSVRVCLLGSRGAAADPMTFCLPDQHERRPYVRG
jgi:hypothetical protein